MNIRNIVVISDLHCGCRVGLCPPGIQIQGGSVWPLGPTQELLWGLWEEFWDKWVPMVTRGDPYAVVLNGDAVDGRHHGSTTQVSQNISDQHKIAKTILEPVVKKCGGRFYMVRGTESHVGQTGENEETLAEELGAIPNERTGESTWGALWIRCGDKLVQFAHHIGTTSRGAYESSALTAELTEMFREAGMWNHEPPVAVVRSHRHRHIEVKIPTANTYGICFTTPAWQGKTPFAERIPGGRVNMPQIGG